MTGNLHNDCDGGHCVACQNEEHITRPLGRASETVEALADKINPRPTKRDYADAVAFLDDPDYMRNLSTQKLAELIARGRRA